LRFAPWFLPKTNCIFGRASKPKSHWVYCVPEAESHERFQSEGMIVEVRGNRLCTPASPSKFTRTCFAMAAATRWPMRVMIRGRFRTGSVTAAFNIRFAIPSWHRRGSRTFGADGSQSAAAGRWLRETEAYHATSHAFPFRH
jgi:hypothetical protein